MRTGGAALLEREGELATLGHALERARAGQGSVLLVEGPPGAGKSRLLSAAAELARAHEMSVLAAHASELEQGLPFGVAQQLLDVSVATPAGDAGERTADASLAVIERLRETLLERLSETREAGGTPTPAVILIDDAQVADRSSLRFLNHVVLCLDRLLVALVAAIRSGEEAARGALLDELRASPRAEVICPAPLSSRAIGELLSAAWGDTAGEDVVAACVRATGGNPFYLTELTRELTSSTSAVTIETIERAAPQTVLHAVMARIGRCPAHARALATAVAVLGDGSRLALAAELARLDIGSAEEAADALARASLLVGGEPLRFAHPLIASTLHNDIGSFARARLHGRAAELLRREGATVDRVAMHLVHAPAGAQAGVVELLRAAARLARNRGEPAAAATLLERALAEPPAEEIRGGVELELADALATAGSPGALPHFERALEQLADPRDRARACLAMARTLHHATDFAQAAELADRGREQLDESDPLREHLLGTWIGAAMLHHPLLEQLRARVAPLVDAIDGGWRPSDPTLLAQLAAWITGRDGPAEVVGRLAEAAFEADPLVDGDPRGAALGFATATLVYIDELETAESHLTEAIEASRQRGAVIAGSIAHHFRAYVHYHRGRLGQAASDAERSLEIYRDGWADSPWSTPILAQVQLELGDLAAAAETVSLGESSNPQLVERALLLEARSRLLLCQGDPGAALDAALAAGEVSEHTYDTASSRMFDWVRLAAQATHAAGRRERASELAEEAMRRARRGGSARQIGAALTTAGAIQGGEEGLAMLTEATRRLQASPSRLELVHAQLQLGAALRRAGRRGEARDLLYRVLEEADRQGARPVAGRAREELRSLGLRPRRAARSGVSALTPSEQRVAALAAGGLSTREVAAELYLSTKTVENHLTRIYRKLEISGRGGLPAALNGAARLETGVERS